MDRAAVIRVSYEAVAPFSTPRGEAFGITLSLAASARFNASCGGMPVTPPTFSPHTPGDTGSLRGTSGRCIPSSATPFSSRNPTTE